MNFMEAVKAMREGKKVTRKFGVKEAYLYIEDCCFMLHYEIGVMKEVPNSEDIEATDWKRFCISCR